MLTVTQLGSDQFKEMAKLFSLAYPGAKLTPDQYVDRLEKWMEVPNVQFYKVMKDQELIGGMRYHDFTMNLLQKPIKAGGIGSVAVSLTHKKEKIAFNIMQHFLKHYRECGMSMTLLYPFHPGFYKRMGFGFGSPIHQFRLEPHQFPGVGDKSSIVLLNVTHTDLLFNYYAQQFSAKNGLIQKERSEFEKLLKDDTTQIVGFLEGNSLEGNSLEGNSLEGNSLEGYCIKGYLIFKFESNPSSFLVNDLVVQAFLYDNAQVFLGFCAFLKSQNDQVRHVVFNTQEPDLQFAFEDPRSASKQLLTGIFHETNAQGTGVMYRVINIPKLFGELQHHNFGGQTLCLELQIYDTFLPENQGTYTLQFDNGSVSLPSGDHIMPAVKMAIDIADFSSLITCSTDVKTLYRFGRLQLSSETYLKTLQLIFGTDNPPICLTGF